MIFRRFIFILFFLSVGHSVVAEAALSFVSDINAGSIYGKADPCAESAESPCDGEAELSSPQPNAPEMLAVVSADFGNNSNSKTCSGSQCFLRASCGSIYHLMPANVNLRSLPIGSNHFEFTPPSFDDVFLSLPIKPPIT